MAWVSDSAGYNGRWVDGMDGTKIGSEESVASTGLFFSHPHIHFPSVADIASNF